MFQPCVWVSTSSEWLWKMKGDPLYLHSMSWAHDYLILEWVKPLQSWMSITEYYIRRACTCKYINRMYIDVYSIYEILYVNPPVSWYYRGTPKIWSNSAFGNSASIINWNQFHVQIHWCLNYIIDSRPCTHQPIILPIIRGFPKKNKTGQRKGPTHIASGIGFAIFIPASGLFLCILLIRRIYNRYLLWLIVEVSIINCMVSTVL